MIVAKNTKTGLSLFFIIAISPTIKAVIPEAKPESIDSPIPGLIAISLKIVSPAETDAYIFRKNNLPITNNKNMAIINPTDHLPNLVFGKNLIFFIEV